MGVAMVLANDSQYQEACHSVSWGLQKPIAATGPSDSHGSGLFGGFYIRFPPCTGQRFGNLCTKSCCQNRLVDLLSSEFSWGYIGVI